MHTCIKWVCISLCTLMCKTSFSLSVILVNVFYLLSIPYSLPCDFFKLIIYVFFRDSENISTCVCSFPVTDSVFFPLF